MLKTLHSQLVKNAATILRPPFKIMPSSLHQKALLESLNIVFKEALLDDDFAFLTNKWLRVNIRDLQLSWYISYQDDKLVISKNTEKEDVSFSGDLNDLILIAGRKEDPDTLFFQRRLVIEGDTELGLEVKNLMDSIDLDQLPSIMQIMLSSLANFVQQARLYQTKENSNVINTH